jgi:quercetin dioxygenase-like cupin family protein
MRIATTAIVLLASAVAVSAQPAAPAPNASVVAPMQTYDVPTTGKPQTFSMLHRVFKPDEHIGMHTHQGVEISWVVRGTIRLAVRGGESKTYKAGESFLVPRGVVHNPINIGKDEAEIAVNYILDKGAPLRDPLPGNPRE